MPTANTIDAAYGISDRATRRAVHPLCVGTSTTTMADAVLILLLSGQHSRNEADRNITRFMYAFLEACEVLRCLEPLPSPSKQRSFPYRPASTTVWNPDSVLTPNC
jgi:hypothetical protein